MRSSVKLQLIHWLYAKQQSFKMSKNMRDLLPGHTWWILLLLTFELPGFFSFCVHYLQQPLFLFLGAMAKRRAEIEEELEMEAESEKNARESGSKEGDGDGKTVVENADENEMGENEMSEGNNLHSLSYVSTGDVEMKETDPGLQEEGLDEGEIE